MILPISGYKCKFDLIFLSDSQCFSRGVGEGDLLVVLVVQDDVVLIDNDVGHTREGRES